MKIDLVQAMSRALGQTRASDVAGATRTLQSALGGSAIEARETAALKRARRRRPLGEVVDTLSRSRPSMPGLRMPGGKEPSIPEGATYERRRFASAAGARDYTLYVPSAMPEGPQGLVLMLHGCTQDADDFALGTGMNAVAERNGLIVAYPEQPRSENMQGCWNWFRPSDQRSGQGEPEILAGLARALTAEYAIDPSHIFVAGLSAGGAMAAILGVTNPDVFRAIGVHSGLPHGAASDVMTAFSAMHGDPGPGRSLRVPAIVFHGGSDATVSPANGDRIFRAAAMGATTLDKGLTAGRTWERRTAEGAEFWLIEDAGHAWAGGSPSGSYVDAAGPDASAEMVRFFLDEAAK